MTDIKTKMQQRRALASVWTSNNPVLSDGEIGVEKDTHKLKLGDGSTAWNSLPYAGGTGSGAETAAQLTFTPEGTISASNVQAAITELDTEVYSALQQLYTQIPAAGPTTASELPFVAHGTLSSTNVQAAIQELDDETQTALAALSSGSEASSADEVSFTPHGTISSTNVQAAIQELDDETQSALAAIEAGGAGVQSTVGYGLPTTSGRNAGDLHYENFSKREYTLIGTSWEPSSGSVNTTGAGLPSFAARTDGDHAYDETTGRDYVLVGDSASEVYENFNTSGTLIGHSTSVGAKTWLGGTEPGATDLQSDGDLGRGDGSQKGQGFLDLGSGSKYVAFDVVKNGIYGGVDTYFQTSRDRSTNPAVSGWRIQTAFAGSTQFLVRVFAKPVGQGYYDDWNGVSDYDFLETVSNYAEGTRKHVEITVTDTSCTVSIDGAIRAIATFSTGGIGNYVGVYTDSIDTFAAAGFGTLEWKLTQPAPVLPTTPANGLTKSTVDLGIPPFTNRLDGDLSFDQTTQLERVLVGSAGSVSIYDDWTGYNHEPISGRAVPGYAGHVYTNLGHGTAEIRGNDLTGNDSDWFGVDIGAGPAQQVGGFLKYEPNVSGPPVHLELRVRSAGAYSQGYSFDICPRTSEWNIRKNGDVVDNNGTVLASGSFAFEDGIYSLTVTDSPTPELIVNKQGTGTIAEAIDIGGSVPTGTYVGGFVQAIYEQTKFADFFASSLGSLRWATLKSNPQESMTFSLDATATKTIPNPKIATMHQFVLTQDCAFTFPTPEHGLSITLVLKQDATGGWEPSWPVTVDWGDAGAPTISPEPGTRSVLNFICPSTDDNRWLGFFAGGGFGGA